MDYHSKLVCPVCKTKLDVNADILRCKKCKHQYPIIEGIPIFIDSIEQKKWNNYHIEEYTPLFLNPKREDFTYNVPINEESYCSAPFIENDYYEKYKDNWKVMLDLGCGDGVFSAPLSSEVDEIYCVDTSFVALKRLLRREKENMYPINADGDSLPFPNDFFDGVFFIFVVEHIADPFPLLSEIKRILKPSGYLILSTDSKFYYRYFRIIMELLRYRHYRPDDPTHVNLMTPKEVRNMIKKAGFITEQEDLSYIVRESWRKFIPKFIPEPFLTSLIVHKCRQIK